MGVKSRTFEIPSANGTSTTTTSKNYRVKLTDLERKKVEAMIKNAKSLEDIIRLEKELNEGRVPTGAQGDDAMEEWVGQIARRISMRLNKALHRVGYSKFGVSFSMGDNLDIEKYLIETTGIAIHPTSL